MKSILLSLCLLFAIPQENWISYTDPLELFSIMAPGPMESQEQIVKTESREQMINSFYYKSTIDSTENYLYLVNYYEVTDGLFVRDSLELNTSFLELMAGDLANNIKGELLYVNPVTDKQFTSLEYRIVSGEEEDNLKGKIILTPTHLFSIQVYTVKDFALNKSMDRFINSFRLLN